MPILNLRNTAGEFEPIPAMIGPQGAQGVPGPNEITTATATPLSGVLVGKDGHVKEGVAGEDYVPPISGAAAGLAVFTATNGMQEAKSAADTRNALGAINGIWPILTGGSGMSGTTAAAAANWDPAIVDVNTTRGVKWGNVVVLELAIHMASGATMPAASTPLVRLAEGYRPAAMVYVAAMSDGSVTTEFNIWPDGNISSPLVPVAGRWYVGTVAFLLA